MGVAAKGPGASRPDQKVDPLGGPFGSANISEYVFKNLGPEPFVFSKS